MWDELRTRSLAEQRAALADSATRSRLVQEANQGDYGRSIGAETRKPEWEHIYPMEHSALPPFRSIADRAQELNQDPMEVFIDIALKHDLDIFFIQAAANQDQEVVLELMRHPYAIPTFSDSGAHVTQIMDSSLQTHMLGHWVRNQKAFTLEEAVHRMTQVPAEAWGFNDRGVLAEGKAADINVFDASTVSPNMPELLHDLPSGAPRLRQTATGFAATIVNGEVLVENGEPTGSTPGRLLRGPLAQ